MTIRYTFDVVKYQASKSLPCPKCSKRVKRAKTFEQTLSPFNKNAQGVPKSRAEIWAEEREQAVAWQKSAELCRKCQCLVEGRL